MKANIWKYLAIALVVANVIYWLIMPVWNWKSGIERELMAIGQIIVRVHPDQVQQRQPAPAPPTEEAEK